MPIQGQFPVARRGVSSRQGNREDGIGAELGFGIRVPSAAIILASSRPDPGQSSPTARSRRVLLTWRTALSTPLPMKRFASPSRNSTASREPVEAPEGTAARPMTPDSSYDVRFYGRVAARIDDFAAADIDDTAHNKDSSNGFFLTARSSSTRVESNDAMRSRGHALDRRTAPWQDQDGFP